MYSVLARRLNTSPYSFALVILWLKPQFPSYIMAQKRKSHPSASHGVQSKRHRFNNTEVEDDAKAAIKAQIDPTYGQRSAFPGLDGPPSGDDLFYGPAEDGLEYLRMVR